MKSKIIKVSIILIFMMFSAGLFNFCFALEYTNFIEGGGIPLKSVETDNAGNSISTLKNAILLPKYNEPSFDNIVGSPDFSGLVSPTTKESVYTNNINNHKYILYLYNGQDGYQLFCDVPINDGFVFTIKKDGFVDIFLTELYKPNVISSVVRLVYDFDNNCWNVGYKYNNNPLKPQSFQYSISGEFYLIESYIDIYHSIKNATSFNESRLIYDAPEYVDEPTEEELIVNCDFKVNFKFSPDNDDYPTKVDKHWYVYETCLVTHTMSNWSNYKVDMSISANKENSRGGANTYFELYNNNGDKLINKHDLENNIAVNGDLAEGDFYLLLTDNISDVMTITYNIYNNYTSELIMKKVYKVKFSQGGFGAVDYTGTIIEDSTYDKNGEIISGSNTGFETNGNDATTGTGSSDYYDVTDLELITNNATNTINLTKQCFAILPGFIWVMVGIFLSVCLALRILGR